MAAQVEIEFLWWRECPSWERALEMLREEMERAGLEPDAVRLTEIDSEADAERARFPGSPTIRIGGTDFQEPDPATVGGLTCRVYRKRDGRTSPLPDSEDLREALERASKE